MAFSALLWSVTMSVLLFIVGAHMSVTPEKIAPGGRETFTFSISHDCGEDTLGTSNFTIVVPDGLYSVKVEQIPNWHVLIHSKNLSEPVKVGSMVYNDTVTAVEFHGFLADGFYKNFGLKAQAGELENGTKLYWKGYQECHGDGEPISWATVPTADDPDPRYPAILTEVIEEEGHGHHR